MRVAIYSRKSIETDTGESIKNQITFCKQYIERQNIEAKFEIFEDEGFSGGNINRPSFQRLMELVKLKQFDVVIVYKIDRVARNIVDFVNIYDELEKFNVKLISVTEGFDPSTPAGKMMMLLLASFAEMERMNIAQRVKDNMKELAKMGRWSGGTPPTGYVTRKAVENGKKVTYLELNKSEGEIIKKIFTDFANGYSSQQISKSLKEQGLTYSYRTILGILINPTYLKSSPEAVSYLEAHNYTVYGDPNGFGFLPYNRRPRINGKKNWKDDSKFVSVSNHIAPINLDTWIKVHEMLEKKKVAPHPRESNYTFLSGGILRCKCGAGMYVEPGRLKKDNTRNFYFRCSNTKKNLCNCNFLRVDIAEKEILEFYKAFLQKSFVTKYFSNLSNSKNIEIEIKKVKNLISTNEKSINNLIDKLMLLSNDAAKPITLKIEELTKNNNVLKDKLLGLQREQLLDNLTEANIDAFHKSVENFIYIDDIEKRRICLKNIATNIYYDFDTEELKVEVSNLQ